ncbi:MAG: FtsQ-type POTRA domain-containing protein [Oscillospiraceae bacterium]|nr:FtsQ-type POTRA domain-containing protein [Oscillospiraceae bacterium]
MSERKKRRISRSTVLYLPASVLAIGFLTVFGLSVFTRIMEINVTGISMYSREEIIESSGISPSDNLLFFDMDAALEKIQAEMPFVRDVKIKREPPSAILIEVTESTALAAFTYQGGVLIVDSDCKVLKKADSLPEGLIEITGLSTPVDPAEGSPLKAEMGNENQLQYLKDVLSAIEKEGMQNDISYLDVANTSNINFGYLGRFRVILGNPSNVRHKLSQLPDHVTKINTESSSVDISGEINMSGQNGEYRFTPKT